MSVADQIAARQTAVAAAGASARANAAPQTHDTFTGFLNNLVSGAGNALLGLGEAPYFIGKAAWHDATKSGPSQLAQMGQSIANQYKSFYYDPLSKGDFGRFAQNLYDQPVQPLLDVATLFTDGGGAAGKVGEELAKAGEASRLAQLGAKVAGKTIVSADDYAKLPVSIQMLSRPARDGSRIIPKMHDILSPHSPAGVEPAVLHSYPVSRNPAIRARQAAVESLLARYGPAGETPAVLDAAGNTLQAGSSGSAIGRLLSGPNSRAGYFAPEVRGARLAKDLRGRLGQQAGNSLVMHALAALKPLKAHEDAAAGYIARGFTEPLHVESLVAHHQGRVTELGAQAGKGNDRLRAANQAVVDSLIHHETGRPTKLYNEIIAPSDKTRAAALHGSNLSDALQPIKIARGVHGGGDAADAAMSVHDRAMQPLRSIMGKDYELPEGSRMPAIISASEPRAIGARVARTTAAGVMKSGEDRLSTGHAFENGLYEPGISRIIKSAAVEMRHASKLADIKYIAQVSRPIDPLNHDQAVLLQARKLIAVHPGEKLAQQIGELSRFVTQHMLPAAIKAGDHDVVEMAQMLEGWNNDIAKTGMAVPAGVYHELVGQVTRSQSILARILKGPVKFWKALTLGLKGSFYANCFFGHLLLGFVGYGPEFLKEALVSGRAASKYGRLIDEHGSNVLHQGDLLNNLSADLQPTAGMKTMAGKVNPVDLVNALGYKFAHVGSKFTTVNFRRAAFTLEIKHAGKRLAAADGTDFATAVDKIMNDPEAVDALGQKMMGNMLDYSKLTPFERDTLRTYYPFWNYMRAITGRTVRLTLDQPWKAAVMNQLSGEVLRKNRGTMFGGMDESQIPEYDKGLMPIGATKDGKTPVLSTYGFDLFSTPADILSQLGGAVDQPAQGNASPFAQFNPYIGAAIDAATGNSSFFGSPLPGSRWSIFLHQLALGFPQYSWYERARYPNPNSVVQRTLGQSTAQYFGAPVGTLNLGNLQRSAAINQRVQMKTDRGFARQAAQRAQRDIGATLGVAS